MRKTKKLRIIDGISELERKRVMREGRRQSREVELEPQNRVVQM